LQAVVPLVVLVALIAAALAVYGLDALDGPVQVALLLVCMLVSVLALRNGHPWRRVQTAGEGALGSITSAVFILLAAGAVIGTWNLSGTIPTLVYYGIQVISASWYYIAAAVICGVIALSVGSSWTTAGTIGAGLVGMADVLGASPAIAAGAVISGAYLGDKLSPLSETTILTAQLVHVDLRTHLKAQVWTSIPAFLGACVVFVVLGFTVSPEETAAPISLDLHTLDEVYWISPWNLLPLVLLVVLAVRRVPPSLSLMTSALFAGVQAVALQPDVVRRFVGSGEHLRVRDGAEAVWSALATGFHADTGVEPIDQLVSRGGMSSMLLTLWLVIGAVTLGALLEELGFIARLTGPLLARAESRAALWFVVFGSAFGLNIVAGDQYIALVLPSRTFRAEFEKRRLAPQNLSRLCADSATVTSPLVPWNSCGAFMSSTLGVSTLLYAPFCLFSILSPLLSLFYGVSGLRIVALPTDADPAARAGLPHGPARLT
jgi:NhaC family Na+:H+ antiporter